MKMTKCRIYLFALTVFLFLMDNGFSEELNIYKFQNPSNSNSDSVIKLVIPSLLNQLNQNSRGLRTSDDSSYKRKQRTNYELYDSEQWRLKNFYNSGALMFRMKNALQNQNPIELSQQELQNIGMSFIEILKKSGTLQLTEREEIRFHEIQYTKDDIIDASGQVVSSEKKEATVEYRRFIDGIQVIGESLLRVHVSPKGEIKGFDFLWRPISGVERKVNVSISNIRSNALQGMTHKLYYFEEGRHKLQDKIRAVYEVKPYSIEARSSYKPDEITPCIIYDAITGDIVLSSNN